MVLTLVFVPVQYDTFFKIPYKDARCESIDLFNESKISRFIFLVKDP